VSRGQDHAVGSFFLDEIVHSQWGRISAVAALALTHSPRGTADSIYQPKSLAALQPNSSPFLAASINPLTTNAAYVQDSSDSTGPTSLVLGLAVFLMIGYGWLRGRWTQNDQSWENAEVLLAATDSAAAQGKAAA
jgi:hypothetical protein